MKSYNTITPKISRTDKEYYERTPVENGQMSASVVKITWWLGLGLLTVGGVISYNKVFSSTSADSYTDTTNLIQSSPRRSDSGNSGPVYRLQRNGYSPIKLDHSVLKYKFLGGYNDVIEPHANMELNVPDYDDSSKYYSFSVCKSTDTSSCSYGKLALNNENVATSFAVVPCAPFEAYTVTVDEIDSATNDILSSSTSQAMCMYVRRELRSLTPTDLAAAMDALSKVYTVSDEDGQALYGEEYHNYAYALNFHHFNAAWRESDHIHEGNGFVPQHIKMTNLVEASMQLVDPSVALPYWDFTMDHALNHVSFNSDIFTETMFGGLAKPTDLFSGFYYKTDSITSGQIPTGRWAGLKAEMNDRYPELKNGYGYMRAPWNMNPSPYVSRFAAELQIGVQLPSCSQHYDMLTYANQMEFLYDIQNGPHATTHALTGGTYGCDVLKPMLEAGLIADEDSMKYICSSWVFTLKEFYRYNFITPYQNCVVADDVDSSVCGFTCTTDTEEKRQFLSNMQQKLSKYVPADIDDAGWDKWTDFVCNGDGYKIFSGDHLESASPADPSFWVIHPTLERLMQAKSMAGGFDPETDWVADSRNEKVCDKTECYMESEAARGKFDDCCMGHFEDDRTLDFVTGTKEATFGATNKEVLDATDPALETYSMPYIYDGFTWDHCEEDFESLIADVYSGEYTPVEVENQGKLGPGESAATTTTTSSLVGGAPGGVGVSGGLPSGGNIQAGVVGTRPGVTTTTTAVSGPSGVAASGVAASSTTVGGPNGLRAKN